MSNLLYEELTYKIKLLERVGKYIKNLYQVILHRFMKMFYVWSYF